MDAVKRVLKSLEDRSPRKSKGGCWRMANPVNPDFFSFCLLLPNLLIIVW